MDNIGILWDGLDGRPRSRAFYPKMSKATKILLISLGLTLIPIVFQVFPKLTFLPFLDIVSLACYFAWPLGIAGLFALLICWLRSRFSCENLEINNQPIIGFMAVCLGIIINMVSVVFISYQYMSFLARDLSSPSRGIGIIVAGVAFYSLILCGLVSYVSFKMEEKMRYSLIGFALSIAPLPLSFFAIQIVRRFVEINSV